jgi:hypothetical protein
MKKTLGMVAKEMEFKLINSTENSATFSIQSSEETLKSLSFEFELQLNLYIRRKIIYPLYIK